MKIEYKTKRLEKVCTNYSEAEKRYGSKIAEKIHQRIVEIDAAPSVEIMIQFEIGRCHHLKGDREEQYAMDLIHPYRLVFETKGEGIQIVNIVE